MNFNIKKQTILEVIVGSRAYGTNGPDSDTDIRGVAIPPKEYFLGFADRFEQYQGQPGEDKVIYDIRKFFHLAADGNPNVIEILFVPAWCIQRTDSLGSELLNNRHLFLSHRVYYKFLGFGVGQFKHVENSRKKTSGDTKRAELVAKFGYDTKAAMHMVRMMRMAREFLVDRQILVMRPDAGELRAIRNGAWSFEQLTQWYERELAWFQNQESELKAKLPKQDRKGLNELCMSLVEQHLEADPFM